MFSMRAQIVNIFRFAGRTVFVAAIQPYSCSSEAAITRKHMGVAEFQWNYFWGLKFEFYVMYMCHQKKKYASLDFFPNVKTVFFSQI